MAEAQRAKLIVEVDHEIADARNKGRRNYYVAYCLKLSALGTSILAGILGITKSAPIEAVGAVALLPTAAVLIAQELKLQQKANYFYGAAAAFRRIRAKGQFTDESVHSTADLAIEIAELQAKLNEDWDKRLNFSWSDSNPAR